MTEKGLESLQVWQKACSIAVLVCRDIVTRFPDDEKWSLSSQMRRSVQSIPANIAEGFGRYYFQEGIRYSYIARGSLDETYSHLNLAHSPGYISAEQYAGVKTQLQEVRRMLNGYIRFLKESKRGINEPGSGLGLEQS